MKKIKLSVDRLEEDSAILLAKGCEDEINFPRFLLPSKTEEGDILTFSIQRTQLEIEKAKAKVKGLLEKIKKNNKFS